MFLGRSSQLLGLVLAVSILLGGCASHTVSLEASPEKLGKIGATLHNRPQQTEQILEQHDITRTEFREAVNTISEDPDRAKRYRKAFEKEMRSLNQTK